MITQTESRTLLLVGSFAESDLMTAYVGSVDF